MMNIRKNKVLSGGVKYVLIIGPLCF